MSTRTVHKPASRANAQAAVAPPPLSAWADIRKHLEEARYRLNREIGSYPTPIPNCDQDYNHMLAQRERLNVELARLEEYANRDLAGADAFLLIEEFIRSSTVLDSAGRKHVQDALSRRR